MSTLDSMLERNQDFAARESAAGALIPSLPVASRQMKAMIIGCADMRVDPARLLELAPGEAVVLRNIGGRITPGLLEELGMLGQDWAGDGTGSRGWRGVSPDRAAAYGLRDYTAGGGDGDAGALLSGGGRGGCGEGGGGSSGGGGGGCGFAEDDSWAAGGVDCFRAGV